MGCVSTKEGENEHKGRIRRGRTLSVDLNYFDLTQITHQIIKETSMPNKGSDYLREQIEVKGPEGQEGQESRLGMQIGSGKTV